jgi:RNA polymerase sigma-70 factor (ECF subfamily)
MKASGDTTKFSEPDFIEKLKERDNQAISSLVSAYTGQLYHASLGLGFDQNSAHELVQSVWVTFFDAVPTFQGKSHVRTFLFGVLYNKASESWRARKHFDSAEPIEDILEKRFHSRGYWVKPPVDPEEFLLATEKLHLIEECLERLPLNQRMAFSLKEVDGEKSSEICKILDVSITNLGVLLFRAKNRLRECIESKS